MRGFSNSLKFLAQSETVNRPKRISAKRNMVTICLLAGLPGIMWREKRDEIELGPN